MEPERDAWQAGERVVIHARFHNTAGQSFSYTAGGRCEFYLRVWVANTTGEVTSHGLWPWPRHEPGSCAEVMTRVTIGPGQELVDTVSWDGSLEPRGGRPFVAPGDYVVHASFYPWSSAAFPWDASGQAVVRVLARLGDMPGS